MLKISHETLYTKSEILGNVRAFLTDHPEDDTGLKLFFDDVEIVLSIALGEPRDFVKGAIRPTRKEGTP